MRIRILAQKKVTLSSVASLFFNIYIILVGIVRLCNNSKILLNFCTLSLLIAGMIGFYLLILHKNYNVILYGFLMIGCWLYIYLLRNEWHYQIVDIIDSIAFLGASYILFLKAKNYRFYSILYYIFSAYIIFELIVLKQSIRGFMKDGTSYNYISIMVLFYLTILNIVRIKNDKKLQVTDFIILLVISVISYGRGGILTALIYLGLFIIIKMIEDKKKQKTILGMIIALLMIVIGGNQILNYISQKGFFAKFSLKGLESERIMIWNTYLNSVFQDFFHFITGGSPSTIMHDGNLHNMFLQLLAAFGPIFFIITIFMLIRAIYLLYKNREYELLIVTMAIIARAFTDKLLFRNYFELFFYYILFYHYLKHRIVSKSKGKDYV